MPAPAGRGPARYLLDINTASFVIRGVPAVREHLLTVPARSICVSAITEAELRFGVARIRSA